MQMRKHMMALAMTVALVPAAAQARPCDAAPGARFEHEIALGEWERHEIGRVAPAGPARLYLTRCGMDCVRGIRAPQPAYDAAFEVNETGIRVILSSGGAERGTLRMAWPERYVWFGADPELSLRRRATLYNELRLFGEVIGSGDFATPAPVEAELVLSGKGDMCVLARNFDGWTLSVAGETAAWRLFGRLRGR